MKYVLCLEHIAPDITSHGLASVLRQVADGIEDSAVLERDIDPKVRTKLGYGFQTLLKVKDND